MIVPLLAKSCVDQRSGNSGHGNLPNIGNFCHMLQFSSKRGRVTASDSIHVRVTGALQNPIQQQIGPDGLDENASKYISALIRRDLQTSTDAREWLHNNLEPAMRAGEEDFVAVSAADIIRRNQKR